MELFVVLTYFSVNQSQSGSEARQFSKAVLELSSLLSPLSSFHFFDAESCLTEQQPDGAPGRPEEADDGAGWERAGSTAGLLLQLPECFLLSPVAGHPHLPLLLLLLLLLASPDCPEEDTAETEAAPA